MRNFTSGDLMRNLTQRTTGLNPSDGTNFETALDYVHAHLKCHIGAVGTDGFAVSSLYVELIQTLERHSALAHQVPVCVPEPLDSLLVAGELSFSVSAFATRTLAVRACPAQ